ncbi:MAG: methylmalonyl-CoA epimerase [Dethiobacter sp.]|nr:methylmalonyl-CoA epimerase [Dethiobacter sp.]
MIKKIDHIGVAVKSIAEAARLYESLGLKISETEEVESQKVRVAFLPTGDSEVELLESTDPEGPIAKFIAARGEGIQHIAFRVDNIETALATLKDAGIRLIDEKPRPGAGGARIAFLHPKETFGTLIELCEREE